MFIKLQNFSFPFYFNFASTHERDNLHSGGQFCKSCWLALLECTRKLLYVQGGNRFNCWPRHLLQRRPNVEGEYILNYWYWTLPRFVLKGESTFCPRLLLFDQKGEFIHLEVPDMHILTLVPSKVWYNCIRLIRGRGRHWHSSMVSILPVLKSHSLTYTLQERWYNWTQTGTSPEKHLPPIHWAKRGCWEAHWPTR